LVSALTNADKEERMRAWQIGGLFICATLTFGTGAFAQTPTVPPVFVDAAIMTDRDPTEFFYGSDKGSAGRGAVGVHLSKYNSLRFEVDVPRWRVRDTDSSAPVWCAPEAACVGGPGWVPAHTTTHTQVRTVSYAVLYARHLPEVWRVQVSLLGGGSVENRERRSSGSFDELGVDGGVIRHSAYGDTRSRLWPAAVVGVDAEVKLTSRLTVTPQVRFHTFPYPEVSIVRPGIALRWRF
jgi:hypothetical protein